MAEFKLGRIRFIWKGNWSASTVYYKDDIVRNGGNTYVCIAGHTAPTLFTTDQSDYWNKISDGVEWKSDWQTGTYYKVNDIVKYGGYLYIANTAHTSASDIADGLELDQSKWDLFCEGFDYKADWNVATRYKINDIVKYNGTIYICTEEHTSAETTADGLEVDQSKWDIFSEGFYWTDTWSTTTRYKVNDIVRYGGTLYICNEGHISASTEGAGLEADQSKWDYLHKGIEYKGNWSAVTRYKVNDVVKYGGGVWICVTPHVSTTSLAADEINWDQFVEGLEFEDSWDPGRRYQPGDFVTYGGYSYVAITNNQASKPSDNPADWDLFTTGFRFIGDYDDDSSLREYIEGDVVRLGGFTYLCIEKHTGHRPPNITYWQRLNEGIEWKGDWTDATFYDKGDAVQYGVNSYICILAHTSDEVTVQNRPDQDVTGIVWNLLTAGAETGNLTTEGDLVYYGGAGPTRLGIGQPGQVLKVNALGNAPEWANFGAINNVFYVETNNGINEHAPSYGITVDRPWKTVRYATEQVQAGAIRYNAKTLLEKNRSFIQAEVVEYIDYTYPALTYDKTKCHRDAGQIVDALIWDLSHGGNERSRLAAISYFATDGTTYLADNATETADGIAYIKTVADAVLSNLAPANNYQTLNSVGSPVTQVIDSDYDEESDAQGILENLIDIVVDAIAAGSTAGVPAERKPQNTIFVKTGEFDEVLPIIVPENTAIVGDELRSTRIRAATATVDSADTPYSLAAIGRLQAIISDIITNSSVSKTTTGSNPNTETQVTSRPAGSAGTSTNVPVVEALADEIIDILENGISEADALVFTDTGVTAKTTARTELQTNRATILSDLDTWLQANTALDAGGRTTCLRDAGYIVDALSYDVQYETNWATIIMARAYYEGVVSVLPSGQVSDTIDAMTQLKTITASYMSGATEESEVSALLDEIIDVITNGIGSLDAISYPDISWTSADLQAGHAALLSAKAQIQSDAVQYVKANNDNLDFNETTCSRDAGYIVDALAYDMVFGSNYQSVIAGISYYRATTSAELVINDQLDATVGAVRFIRYASKYAVATGAGARAEELLQDINDWIDFKVNGTGTLPAITGSNDPQTDTGHTYAVEVIEANRTFIQAEIAAYIADTYSGYSYDTAACARDVDRYLDAIKWDLIYTGNYKSTLAARYYSNAVNGSTLEDMFYVRNGTGLRNCTVIGLSGTLGSANAYGTKRPSAGAYVSLDPGWGPNHSAAWITTKSPYVQNVTTFGTGCIGAKIDGSLHNGGNDSIVANDFTQILSDGIGVWCTNLARVELVSVFSYYGHIGYLAENGGKIRATNGNSSYGEYGTVAEGVDITEVPVTGKLTNQYFEAVIQRVFTDGNQILALEFLNAGNNYTTATDALLTINNVSSADASRVEGTYYGVSGTSDGSGTGQVFEISVDASGFATVTIVKGGSGHAPADTITVSDADLGNGGAADLTFDVATVGDATQWAITGEGYGAEVGSTNITDGGVYEVRLLDPLDNFGGEGYIDAQNAAQGGTSTSITLSNTDGRLSSQYVGMAIYITSGKGAGQYGVIDTYNSGTKVATIVKDSDGTAGWDHIVSGTAIQSSLDDTSNYSIEPLLTFDDAPSALYADRAKGRAIVEDNKIIAITIWDPGSGYATAPSMTVTDPNNTVEVPHEVRIGNGVLTQPTWANRGAGFVTASAEVTGDGYMDRYQPGTIIRVYNLTSIPKAGSNVTFDGLSDYYKLVVVRDLTGSGPYAAQLQISPELTISDAPDHDTDIEMRIRYSQVRLTGHDFLDVGTGNYADTNYPGIPVNTPDPDKETVVGGGGRVFYTSTDQDGNFRVGRLFNVEQSTGIATLNADAFNISGLQELSLGEIALGGTGATITEFSVDGTFTANSDNIVPTQKAIKTYIASQIGGGAGELNVNSVTAGSIYISGQEITTTTGDQINILQKVNYTGGISGSPVAMNYFLQQ